MKIVKNAQGQIPEDEKKSQAKNKNYFPPKKAKFTKQNKVTTRKRGDTVNPKVQSERETLF